MIKSMTGYGKAEAVLEHKKITVEIRSLNSKQLDLAVKVPAVYRQSEYEIRNLIGKRLLRGKIDAYVSYEITGDSVPVNIDRKTFTAYFGQIREIAAENGIDWNGSALDAAVVPAVLRLPEVIQNDQQTVSEAENQALKRCVEEAVDHMEQFRIQEGRPVAPNRPDRTAQRGDRPVRKGARRDDQNAHPRKHRIARHPVRREPARTGDDLLY